MIDAPQTLNLIGYTSYEDSNKGFCLPIFGHKTLPDMQSIQYIDELEQTIITFKLTDFSRIVPIDSSEPIPYSVGMSPVFVFKFSGSRLVYGHLDEIVSDLKEFESKNPKEIAILLQINDLIGSQSKKRDYRKKFRNTLYDAGDLNAAHSFFADSILRTELWNYLLNSAPSVEASRRILAARSHINITIGQGNKVAIHIENVSPEDISNINQEEIVSFLQNELDETLKPESETSEEIMADHQSKEDAVIEGIIETRKAGRQEERVSILIRIFLENGAVGKSVLESYKSDRGRFATEAIRSIKSLMVNDRPPNLTDSKIAKMLVSRLYQMCFPMNRGALLFYLAKHLSFDYEIAETIENILFKSNALFVKYWQDAILEAIASNKKRNFVLESKN